MEKTPQPNSHQCFVCGLANSFGLRLRFYNQAPGEVIADCIIADHHQGYPGVVHGGVVAAMLDEAASRAHIIVNDVDGQKTRFMYTARMNIRYRQNVPTAQPLQLVGKAGNRKGRTAQATSFLYNDQGVLLAEAELLLVDVPDNLLPENSLEELGWKVYPEESANK